MFVIGNEINQRIRPIAQMGYGCPEANSHGWYGTSNQLRPISGIQMSSFDLLSSATDRFPVAFTKI